MAWPLSQDYNEAIQSPESSFSDPELRLTEAKCNAIGIPMPRSGNFADVYEMTAPSGKKWALKCFTRQVAGLRERYAAISAYLKQANLPFMVDFTYLEQGVKVKGQWYPALKMQWVEGFTFNEFVKEYADQPQYLELLSQIWLRLWCRLREAKMAHADLQHGNVLLVPGTKATSLGVRLIDYDGMFVPALAQSKSGEVGHPAFQHPQRLRDGTYSAEVDRFPHLVIYTALRCLMVGGRYLWNKFDNGDNLLFRQQDLEAPANSALFAELRKLSDVEAGKLVAALAQAARQPLEQTPLLDTLAPDRTAVSPRRKSTAATPALTEPSVESLFAAATAGDGTEAAGQSYRRPIKKTNPWMWASAALVLVAVGLAGAVFLMSRKDGKDTRTEAAVAPKRGTETPEKQVAEPGKKPDPKIDPKPDPKIDPKPDPKIDPKPDPKIDPKVDPKVDPQPAPPPPVGQAALSLQGHNGQVWCVAFSPDGKSIVSGGQDSTLKVWDAQTGQAVRTLRGHTQGVKSVVFSPDGKRLFSGSGDSTLKMWDAQTGQQLRTLQGHTGVVCSVAISSDGQRLVSGSWDKTLKVWDAQTGQEVRTLQGHTDRLLRVAFSPDGKRIASCGYDPTLKVWDAQTGQEIASFKDGFKYSISSVTFSPDGKRLIGGGLLKTLRVWDAQTGQEMLAFPTQTHSISSLLISPDGKRLVSSDDQTVRLWDAQTGQLLQSFAGHTAFAVCVALSPDGKRIVSGSWDKTVKVWNLPEPIARNPDPKPEPVPVKVGEIRRFEGARRFAARLAVSPDGRRLLAGCGNDPMLWDIDSGQLLRTLPSHPKDISALVFATDSRRAFAASYDPTVRLLDLETGQTVRNYPGVESQVQSLAVTPDGRLLLAGSGKPMVQNGKLAGTDCCIRVWDVDTGKELRRLEGHPDPVSRIALSPDGKRLISCSGQALFLWEVSTGRQLRRLGVPLPVNQYYQTLAFAPNGRHVVVASSDGKMGLWDVNTDREERRFARSAKGFVNWLTISPDGRYVLGSSGHSVGGVNKDCVVRLWEVASGRELCCLEGHTSAVHGVAFLPDGIRALSTGMDKTLRLWQLRVAK